MDQLGAANQLVPIRSLLNDPEISPEDPYGPGNGPNTIPPRHPNSHPTPEPQPAPMPVAHLQQSPLWFHIHLNPETYKEIGADKRPFTLAEIRQRVETELSQVGRALQEIVAEDFEIPGRPRIRIDFRLSPVDIDQHRNPPQGEEKHLRDNRPGLWAPTIIFWLPERNIPPSVARDLRNRYGKSPSDSRHEAAASKVLDSLRFGSATAQHHPELPVARDAELYHCAFEFRAGLTIIPQVITPASFVYAQVADGRGPVPTYERLVLSGYMGGWNLKAWAARWHLDL
ncbi:hypothetical protein F5Y05DRAFT_409745 [Hypoxylon sp. FL0543]|nr:hypothetical protein F5Y05DRAFT_409745 [Hypoxylon sp. FL0543]